MPADLEGAVGDIHQQLIDLHPPLRHEQGVEALPNLGENVIAGADQLVFGHLDLPQGRLLGEPQLAGSDEVLRDRPRPLALIARNLR